MTQPDSVREIPTIPAPRIVGAEDLLHHTNYESEKTSDSIAYVVDSIDYINPIRSPPEFPRNSPVIHGEVRMTRRFQHPPTRRSKYANRPET